MTAHPIPDVALALHTAVLGKTGSGKTSTAKLAIEQVVAQGSRVCILDPIKSDWWGLTSSADGRRPGLPFQILGGPHGHVPLASSAGAAVAALVAGGDLPLSIVDMAQFEPGGLQAFFNGFAPTLLERMRGVLYLVMEEAHLFAPKERSGIGAETHAIHWAKTLATAGRSKGIRLVLATQRTQSLHNALLGSCETMIAHRLTAPADQVPVLKWLQANTSKKVYQDVENSLGGLPTGTGWICSGEVGLFKKVTFPRISTFDNTATPTGDLADRKVKQAPIDVGKLRSLIGEKVAEAEANDPAKLRARIAELEQVAAGKREKSETVAAPARPASAAEIAAAEQRGYQRGVLEGRAAGIKAAASHVRHFKLSWRAPTGMRSVVLETADHHPVGEIFADAILEMIGEHDGPLALQPEIAPPRPIPRVAAPATARMNGHAPAAAEGAIMMTGPQRQLLKALAWWKAMGHPAPSRAQVAAIAGWKITSGHLKNVAGALSSAGLITYPSAGLLALTEAGAAGSPEPDLSATLIGSLKTTLTGPQTSVLDALLAAKGPLTRADLAADCGWNPTSGHLKNVVGSLSTLEIVRYPEPGVVALQEWVR